MINSINPITSVSLMDSYKKNSSQNSDANLVNENAKYFKIPASCYMANFLRFKGSYNPEKNIYTPINTKRESIDYGSRLYEGPVNESTVDRRKSRKIRARAKKINLENADLSNYNFEKSNFFKSILQCTKLENTNFENAVLFGVNFIGVRTYNTNFKYTNLADANFAGADFGNNTDMSSANIMGADFTNTKLDTVKLENAIYNRTTTLPTGIDPDSEDMILLEDDADLSNMGNRLERIKIRYMDLNRLNFENTSLKRADLKHVYIENSNFRNTNLHRVYAKQATIKDSDFSNAGMKQINLDQAELENVNMKNADLRGAILTWKKANNVILEGVRYDQYTVFNDGFNPAAHGMKRESSDINVYHHVEY